MKNLANLFITISTLFLSSSTYSSDAKKIELASLYDYKTPDSTKVIGRDLFAFQEEVNLQITDGPILLERLMNKRKIGFFDSIYVMKIKLTDKKNKITYEGFLEFNDHRRELLKIEDIVSMVQDFNNSNKYSIIVDRNEQGFSHFVTREEESQTLRDNDNFRRALSEMPLSISIRDRIYPAGNIRRDWLKDQLNR